MTREPRPVPHSSEQPVEDITPNVIASDETVDLTGSGENVVSSPLESNVQELSLGRYEDFKDLYEDEEIGTALSMQTEPENSGHGHSQGKAPEAEPENREHLSPRRRKFPNSLSRRKELNQQCPSHLQFPRQSLAQTQCLKTNS